MTSPGDRTPASVAEKLAGAPGSADLRLAGKPQTTGPDGTPAGVPETAAPGEAPAPARAPADPDQPAATAGNDASTAATDGSPDDGAAAGRDIPPPAAAGEPSAERAAEEPDTEPITPEPATEPITPEPATGPVGNEPDTVALADEPATVAPADEPVGPLLREVPELPAEGTTRALVTALTRLRSEIGATPYPLVMPTAEEARRVGGSLVAQLDDYLLPRLARLDAPLLVVVGGSTGAGKSTLVNSLVRAPVSASGVLRPTTRSPVLVCHPNDMSWFRSGELLPGLTRTPEVSTDPNSLHLVAAPALGEGLAFLDAPDIDSVVDRNRELAAQLLAAADLWLFVTTAARYADAVPWELLHTARQRGTVTALVLDRVPPEAAGEVAAHLSEMLAANDLAAAPLFVLPESGLDGSGLLPEDVSGPLRDWFAHLAGDASARAAVVRQTLDGALAALRPTVTGLAAAADDQAVAAASLTERVDAAYRNARRTVEQGLQDGRLLRGEVLARWQEFVGTGEFLRSLESRIGRFRDRVTAAITGRPAPGRNLQVALESQLATLFRGVSADAAEQAYTGWQAHPAGAALLTPALGRPSADLPERAEALIRDWQRSVLDLVREEAGDKRFVARSASYAVNATGLAVMIAVFTSTAFIPTGAELAVGAGTTVAAQKVLEAVFGDQAIRALAARARADLLERVDALLAEEAARFTGLLAPALETSGDGLRAAGADVERARADLQLIGPLR